MTPLEFRELDRLEFRGDRERPEPADGCSGSPWCKCYDCTALRAAPAERQDTDDVDLYGLEPPC